MKPNLTESAKVLRLVASAPSLQTRVTFLDMHPPYNLKSVTLPNPTAHKWNTNVRLEYEAHPSVAFYRALYEQVGAKWHWVDRARMDDATLAAIIHHADDKLFILRDATDALGFVELNMRKFPQIEISLFGLVEKAIGAGLGHFMLHEILAHILTHKPSRITIQTCTLDHPRALALYQNAGFKPYQYKNITINTRRTPS